MEIIRHRKSEYVSEYRLSYEYVTRPGAGYSFDCDAEGNVDESKLPEAAKRNFAGCRAGHIDRKQIFCVGVKEYGRHVVEDAEGRCDCCDAVVVLSGFTNTCDGCGADYNQSGQRLADRSQWGWDTGESLSDILSIP